MIAELLQASALRQAIAHYVTGQISANDLEEWLVGNLQEILSSGDEAAIQLANRIDALYIEKGEGLIDEKGLRDAIASLSFENPKRRAFNASGSSNAVIASEPYVARTVVFCVKHFFESVAASK